MVDAVPSIFLAKPFAAPPKIPYPLTPEMEDKLTAEQRHILKLTEELDECADLTLRSSPFSDRRNAFVVGEVSDGVLPVAAALWLTGEHHITVWMLWVSAEHWDAEWFQRELDSLSRPAPCTRLPMTTTRWWAKARLHQEWQASWHTEMVALEATIDGLNDIQVLQRIRDRAAALKKRIGQLQRIMRRHLERAPDLFAGLDSVSQIGARLQ